MGSLSRRQITRADLALYDGVDKTYSRQTLTTSAAPAGDSWDGSWGSTWGDSWGEQTATTTTTLTGLTVGDYVDVLQVFGSGEIRSVQTIQAALDRIGTTTNLILLFSSGEWVIDSSITIPANLGSRITGGCTFTISSGATLTFSGPVHVEYSGSAGTGWYSGDGTVTCSVGAYGFPGW